MAASWVKIGKVGRPKGLRGFFHLVGRDEPLGFSLLDKAVRVGFELADARQYSVTGQRHHSDQALLCLAGVDSREGIDELKHCSLWVSREDIPVSEQEYLYGDLLERRVEDVDGQVMGVIHSVYNFGASDIVEVISEQQKLALPLVSAYVDMSFGEEGPIRLTVAKEIFSECWEPR